jgi:microcystin degradation protein MlrC
MLRVFTATLGTETNTFSPLPTGLASFAERMLWRPGQHPEHPTEQTAPLWICRERARTHGWQVIEGTCAFAAPAGITTTVAYETLRDEILGQLRNALPVDIVALGMHGAMVAEGYDDCEGDLLLSIRQLVGPDVAVGVEIDLHGHLSARMLNNATAIVAFKEYPHVDYLERARELLDILAAARRGTVRPRMVAFDCSMIGLYHTSSEPMRSFLEEVRALEGRAGILSISVIHSFPWADVPDQGTKILVIAAEGSEERGKQIAESLGRRLYALRGRTTPRFLNWSEALEQCVQANTQPAVIADTADNPGGGAPGDATFGLREIMSRGLRDVAIGPFYDPMAVRIAFEAGQGSLVNLRIGGKLGVSSGQPVDVRARVERLVRNAQQTFVGQSEPLGDAACVHFDGIRIVLTSLRCQAFGADLFTNLGVEPAACSIIVVKSAHHFQHSFARLGAPILYVADRGALTTDFRSLKLKNVKRPLWPLQPTPLDDTSN